MNPTALLIALLLGVAPEADLVTDGGVFGAIGTQTVFHAVGLRVALLAHKQRNIQMVAEPAFDAAYAVYVTRKKGERVLVARRMKENLFYAVAKRKPADVGMAEGYLDNDIPVEEFKQPMEPERFARLEVLWKLALHQVGPASTARNLRDGVVYYFADCFEIGCLSGTTHSPDEGSRAERLVRVGDLLFKLASCSDSLRPSVRKTLDAEVESLIVAYGGEAVGTKAANPGGSTPWRLGPAGPAGSTTLP